VSVSQTKASSVFTSSGSSASRQGNFGPPQKSPKSKRAQVPPRHWGDAEISIREAMNSSKHQPTDALALNTPATSTEDVVAKELIAYDVASDSNWFRMSFSCANGKQGSLRLPTECLQALIMTLPRMMTQALSARYRDESLRLVYPAKVVRIERSPDPNTFVMTLMTPDEFAVSFSLSRQQLDELSEARDFAKPS
jgi:hypothetical protein